MKQKLHFSKKHMLWAVLGVTVLAFVIRVAAVLTTPGLWPDEAVNGNDAAATAGSGNFSAFYPANNGREGLHVNLLALFFKFFGISVINLRLVSALIGTLTVPAIYLAAVAVFRKLSLKRPQAMALATSFLLAASYWHVSFSRIGFRAILGPLLLSLGVWLLLRTSRSRWLAYGSVVLSGVAIGVGMHTYIAFRLVPLVFLAYLLIELDLGNTIKQKVLVVSAWITGFTVAFAPLWAYFLQHPGSFTGRSGQVSVMGTDSPLATGFESLVKTLGMFHVQGDCNARHMVPCWPTIDPVTGLLALIGLATIIFICRSGWTTKTRVSLFMMALFGAALLPAVATIPEELPHALRVLMAVTPIFIFAGLGFAKCSDKMPMLHKKTVTIAGLLTVASLNLVPFFLSNTSERNARAFETEFAVASQELAQTAQTQPVVFVIDSSHPATERPFALELFQFYAGDKPVNTRYVSPAELATNPPPDNATIVFVNLEENAIEELTSDDAWTPQSQTNSLRIYTR